MALPYGRAGRLTAKKTAVSGPGRLLLGSASGRHLPWLDKSVSVNDLPARDASVSVADANESGSYWGALPSGSSSPSQVRKLPSWPRSWANCSLLQLYSQRNAWANLHILDQPNTFLAPAGATETSGRVQRRQHLPAGRPAGHQYGPGMLNQGGQGGRPAPLASRLHRIPAHFLLNLHGI